MPKFFGARRTQRILGGVSFDSSAQAYFTAAGITGAAEMAAIDAMVVSLKAEGIWNLCDYIWPISPTSSAAALFDLKSATDIVTAVNAPTHSASGFTFNGTTQYLDLGVAPNGLTIGDSTDHHAACYMTSNNATAVDAMIASEEGGGQRIEIRFGTGNYIHTCWAGATSITTAETDQGGFWSGRNDGLGTEAYKNGASLGTDVSAGIIPTINYFSGARNISGTPDRFLTGTIGFLSVGGSISTSLMATYNTIVQAYQTALGRNVS